MRPRQRRRTWRRSTSSVSPPRAPPRSRRRRRSRAGPCSSAAAVAARDGLVGLAEVLAPLGVADDRAADAELEQHRRRDLAGEGALVGPVHVLGEDRSARSTDGDVERRERRAERRRRRRRAPRTPRRTRASPRGPLYIFQLPAISIGQRLRDHGHAGQFLAFEQLERGAAARRRPRRPRRARPSSSSARIESAPPTTEYASALATASATAFVPAAKRGHSKTPIGPFQKIVLAAGDLVARTRARVSGPMSSPSQPSGSSSYGTTFDSASAVERRPPRRRPSAARPRSPSGFSSRICSAILPPTSTVSAVPPRFSQHAELVLDLRAAGDRHERPLDLAEQLAELLELALEQQPRVGRQQLARRRRSTRARGAPSRTRRSTNRSGRPASSRANSGSFFVSPGLKRVFSSTSIRSSGSSSRSAPRPASSRTPGPAPSAGRGASRRRPRPRRGRAAARASAATPGSACRRRPARPRAARSGRRARARACRRHRRREPSAAYALSRLPRAASRRPSRRGRRAGTSSPTRCRTSRTPSTIVPVRHRQLAVEDGRVRRVPTMSVETSGSSV